MVLGTDEIDKEWHGIPGVYCVPPYTGHPAEITTLKAEKLRLEVVELEHKIAEQEASMVLIKNTLAYTDRSDLIYMLRGGIDWDCINSLTEKINKWRYIYPSNPGPFTVSITSPGGDVFSGFAAFDLIRDAVDDGIPIITEVRGYAASMGSILAQAGAVRTVTRYGYVMIHEVGAVRTSLMQLADMRDQVDLLDTLQERLIGIYAERSTLTADQITAKCFKTDWWVGAEEALSLGFVDKITSREVVTV